MIVMIDRSVVAHPASAARADGNEKLTPWSSIRTSAAWTVSSTYLARYPVSAFVRSVWPRIQVIELVRWERYSRACG